MRVEVREVNGDAVEGQDLLHLGRELVVDLFDLQGGGEEAADFGHDRLFPGQALGLDLACLERGLGPDFILQALGVGDGAADLGGHALGYRRFLGPVATGGAGMSTSAPKA